MSRAMYARCHLCVERNLMSGYGYRTTNEKVGAVVLFPVKLAGVIVVIALVVVAYPFVAVAHFATNKDCTLSERFKSALCWPMGILAMNDFMSLGGMNSPTLSRITAGINRAWAKIKR